MLRLSGFELYSRWVPLFYDIPLLKMYRLSTKSLEEQKHPRLKGCEFYYSLTERKHGIVIFLTMRLTAASTKPDFCFLQTLIAKNTVHLDDDDRLITTSGILQ